LSVLEILLRQNLDVATFDGLAVIYIQDLRNGNEIHLARYRGEELQVEPDIAFTAASTIKIGIMTTYYRYFDEPLDQDAEEWMYEMMVYSANETSDQLMERLEGIDGELSPGPIVVTNTLRELGLESTFLGGYFALGSPLLIQPQTPGNQRTDVTTSPDPYNQTTASEIGVLLTDIYRCSEGGGAILAAFPEQLSQDECTKMLDLLSRNKLGWLIEAGVPEGTRVAHKHGYIDSPTEYLVDVGIVYTPGGNYALAICLWNDPPMIWEPTSTLVANLSRAVYNYFNSPTGN
jgi:beta-lactamase class A